MREKTILVTSPSYTLKVLKNFPLRNLEKTFVIADFERLLNIRHVNKILKSMATNEFFDNIISVVLKKNGKYEVIDGQHRITALGLLRDNFYVTKYGLNSSKNGFLLLSNARRWSCNFNGFPRSICLYIFREIFS